MLSLRVRARQSAWVSVPLTACPGVIGFSMQLPPAPAWRRRKLCPAIFTVALREVVAVFGATVKLSAPLPAPLAVLTLSQSALALAIQGQFCPARTLALPAPPAASKN